MTERGTREGIDTTDWLDSLALKKDEAFEKWRTAQRAQERATNKQRKAWHDSCVANAAWRRVKYPNESNTELSEGAKRNSLE